MKRLIPSAFLVIASLVAVAKTKVRSRSFALFLCLATVCLQLSSFAELIPPRSGDVTLGGVAGTTRCETFSTFAYQNGGEGWQAELEPAPATASCAGAARVWTLTLSRGIEKKSVLVSDFASVSNLDDPDNWFSLWF